MHTYNYTLHATFPSHELFQDNNNKRTNNNNNNDNEKKTTKIEDKMR